MGDPIGIRRDDFVSQLKTAQLDVGVLKADYRMLNVDVDGADLDKDGKISGEKEVGALFDRVDRLDKDDSAATVLLAGKNGPTAVAAPMAAIGDLGQAPTIQRKAEAALPGITQASARGARTGVFGPGANNPPGPFAPGGPLGPPTAREIARGLQVKTIRNTIGNELKKDPPDFKVAFSEMGKLSQGEAADFARNLRLNHNDLWQKLGSAAHKMGDADTIATISSDEPALSQKIVAQEAKRLAKAPDVGPNHTLDVMRSIPKNERAEVLREIERTDPGQLRWLRQVCRDTDDPIMRDAFKAAHLKK